MRLLSFFFSSRRRHTRWNCDWSSDVCSSDLGIPALDLTFAEDSRTRVDMNIVMTESGKFVEIQGTGEGAPFTKTEANALIALAERGIVTLIAKQREVLADILTAP